MNKCLYIGIYDLPKYLNIFNITIYKCLNNGLYTKVYIVLNKA